jgi:hypothetical protein
MLLNPVNSNDNNRYLQFLAKNRWFLLGALCFILSFSLSGTRIPTTALVDASWQASIEFAAEKRMQFGPDILFTYGPFGFLTADFSQGFFPVLRIMTAVLLSGLTTWFVISLIRALPPGLGFLVGAWYVFSTAYSNCEQYLFFLMACGSLRLIDSKRNTPASLLFVLLFALLSLIKFTYLIVAVASITLCIVYLVLLHDRRHAALMAVSYPVAVGIFWMSMGQNLNNLPPWIAGCFDISAGYPQAMAYSPSTYVLWLSLGSIGIFFCMLCCEFYRRRSCSSGTICLILLSLFSFMAWKQGLARADDLHVSRYVLSLPLMSALLFINNGTAGKSSWYGRYLAVSLTGIMVCCLAVFHDLYRQTGVQARNPDKTLAKFTWSSLNSKFAKNLKQFALLTTGDYRKCFPNRSQMKDSDRLPEITSRVGNGNIDVMGSLSWLAIGNELKYRPRPVVQSYTAFTPYLQNRNLAFMKSPLRPDWMIVSMDSIDNRLPALDDALIVPWLLKNYSLEWKNEQLALLGIKSQPLGSPVSETLAETWQSFDQPVEIPASDGSGLILQADLAPSLAGKIAALLYRLPPLTVTFDYDKGTITRQFIPLMAKEGVLIDPLLLTNDDIVRYFYGDRRRLKRVSFGMPEAGRPLYGEKIKIRLSRVFL